MDYPQFEQYMVAIEAHQQREEKFDQFMDMFSDGHSVAQLAPELLANYIHLLSTSLGDTSGTIPWYLYECPKDGSPCMWDEEGKEIPMHTLRDLYNYLTQ